jgi:hypothetical protein
MGQKADLVKKIIKSPDFWVRLDAVGTGVAVGVEAGLLVVGSMLPAVPFLLGALGVAAAIGLGGCALYSLYVGATGTWDFLKNAHHDVYHGDKPRQAKPAKPETTLIDRLAHHPRVYPFAKKIAETNVGKKILNSGVGKKLRYGLTQGQRDIFMVSLNTKGSLFVGGGAMTFIVMHIMALPVITFSGVVTTATAIASFYAAKSMFDISCSTRVLIKHIRQKRAEKKAAKEAAKNPSVAPVLVPAPQPAMPVPIITPAFEKAVAPAQVPPPALPPPSSQPNRPPSPGQ